MTELREQRYKETRQRYASCTELNCGAFHPQGHIIIEQRTVTRWIALIDPEDTDGE